MNPVTYVDTYIPLLVPRLVPRQRRHALSPLLNPVPAEKIGRERERKHMDLVFPLSFFSYFARGTKSAVLYTSFSSSLPAPSHHWRHDMIMMMYLMLKETVRGQRVWG